MKLYTKKGDKGYTSLYDGTRVIKSHALIETVGDLDELNSHIGCLIVGIYKNNRRFTLFFIVTC